MDIDLIDAMPLDVAFTYDGSSGYAFIVCVFELCPSSPKLIHDLVAWVEPVIHLDVDEYSGGFLKSCSELFDGHMVFDSAG